jgi:hypothetical protein
MAGAPDAMTRLRIHPCGDFHMKRVTTRLAPTVFIGALMSSGGLHLWAAGDAKAEVRREERQEDDRRVREPEVEEGRRE